MPNYLPKTLPLHIPKPGLPIHRRTHQVVSGCVVANFKTSFSPTNLSKQKILAQFSYPFGNFAGFELKSRLRKFVNHCKSTKIFAAAEMLCLIIKNDPAFSRGCGASCNLPVVPSPPGRLPKALTASLPQPCRSKTDESCESANPRARTPNRNLFTKNCVSTRKRPSALSSPSPNHDSFVVPL